MIVYGYCDMNFDGITGFEWDEHNIHKNIIKHDVYESEAEQVFFNQPLIIKKDQKNSKKESRYIALGKTNHNRLIFLSFTIRGDKIRVISARDMTKKEGLYYEKN